MKNPPRRRIPMGRPSERDSRFFGLAISALFLSCLLPLVSADGGGAVIDVSSFSLDDFETIEQDSYELNFDLVELVSSDADVEVTVELSAFDGTPFEQLSQNLTVASDTTQNVLFSLTSIPYGYTVVEVEVLGDAGSPNATQSVSLSRTLHRLKPYDISLAPQGQILFSGISELGADTGNVSVHDGDYMRSEIAVLNDGDFAWNGTLSYSMLNDGRYDNQTFTGLSVAAQSSVIVQFNSTFDLIEGLAQVSFSLNASGDGDTSDESRELNLSIQPPPLPLMSMSLQLLTSEVEAGDLVEWNLSIFNSGDRGFNGSISCVFGEESLLTTDFSTPIQGETILLISSTARPNLLTCELSGMRLDSASNSPFSSVYHVESAAFESAGSNIPAMLNGPWHEGDMVRFSMLIRNHGDYPGHASLVCETQGVEYSSNPLQLDVDAAGELSVWVPLTAQGDQMVNWSLTSSDGSIDSGLNGTLMVPVAGQQTLTPTISSVSWDAENGIQFSWSVEMSEGIDRDVRIRLGYSNSGFDEYPLDYVVTLEPGITTGEHILGFVDSERVSIRATPVNWTSSDSFTSFTKSVPTERPSYSIEFSQISVPNRPIPGETGSVTVQVRNAGDVAGTEGYLVLSTQEGEFLGEKTTSVIESNQDSSYSFTFSWPEGVSASLKVTWVVSTQSYVASNTFQSGTAVVEDTSYQPPWIGLIGGIGLAVVIVLGVRIYQNREPGSNTSNSSRKSSESNEGKKQPSSAEKIQIGCPECGRQLRVPADYGGQVRCPDCSNRFEVTPRVESNIEDEPVEVIEDIGDGKIEIHCPQCAQSLRIPSEYTGSVRCPACEEVFSAEPRVEDQG